MNEEERGNHKILSKRIDNYSLYFFTEMFDELKSLVILDGRLSEEARDLMRQLSRQLHKDIGHLQCDVMDHFYIVEEGFNFND